MAPSFVPLDLADQKNFKAGLARCPQVTSDYTFVNVWSWSSAYDLTFAQADDLIWICRNRPERQLWAPVGNWQEVDWETFFNRFPELRQPMFRVPEQLARLWESEFGDRISVFPDRDQFDYIYDADDLISLSGNRFHKKKNLLYQFQKKYSYQYVAMSNDRVGAAMAMQNNWCTWRECDSDIQLANENRAIEKVLSHWDSLEGIRGGCLLVDGEMVAYTIGEVLGDDTLVVHFEKGNTDYKGIYQAMNQMFVEHEASSPGLTIRRVNREQDLGDPGLRRSKESYQPAEFIKKYRIAWN